MFSSPSNRALAVVYLFYWLYAVSSSIKQVSNIKHKLMDLICNIALFYWYKHNILTSSLKGTFKWIDFNWLTKISPTINPLLSHHKLDFTYCCNMPNVLTESPLCINNEETWSSFQWTKNRPNSTWKNDEILNLPSQDRHKLCGK